MEKRKDIVEECCGDNFGVRDDRDWIQELLQDFNKHTTTTAAAATYSSSSSSSSYAHDDDDDGDCVMLDGDPDKPVLQIHDVPEELLLVGEKGQVACRHYPHPRHLCANFPFTSTPHEMHCDQCHCYVCDALAPCPHWSAGGHCDATDKLEFWKHQRSGLKNGRQATLSLPQPPTASTPLTHPLQNQFNQVLGSTSFEPVYFPLSRVATPASALSKATDFGFRNIPTKSRNQRFGCDMPRNTLRPNLILHHLRNTGDNFKGSPKSGSFQNSRTSQMLKRIASPLVEEMLNTKESAAAAQGTIGGNICLLNRVSDQKLM